MIISTGYIIGKDKNIVIDWISRAHTGQIFVQLSDPEAVDKVITNWDPETLGHSTVYRSRKPYRRYGVLKGIPLNLSDDEIKDYLKGLGFIDTRESNTTTTQTYSCCQGQVPVRIGLETSHQRQRSHPTFYYKSWTTVSFTQSFPML